MALTTWLKRTQLKRVERKLRSLRARQRHVRDREADLRKENQRGMTPETFERKQKALHDEKEELTKKVNHLVVEEERLKAELRASEDGSPASS